MDYPHLHVAAKARAALLIIVFALFPSLCEARDPWETPDYMLIGATLATLAVDWGQTRHIAKNPERFYEKNRILGASPSVGKVDAYFLGAMVGTVAVAHLLPTDYRRLLLAGTHQARLGAVAEHQPQGVEQDRLARAGLAGEHAQPRPEGEIERLDQDDITDRERGQHGRAGTLRDALATRNAASAAAHHPPVSLVTIRSGEEFVNKAVAYSGSTGREGLSE